MSELVEFLLARIAEDEGAARSAMNVPDGILPTGSIGPQMVRGEWAIDPAYAGAVSQHAPMVDHPDAAPDEVGWWGWRGGPVFRTTDPESLKLEAIFGAVIDQPDRPYVVTDSGLWDESEPVGAQYFRASVPASAGRGTVDHIRSWSPRRVLAECEAKREIIELHHPKEPNGCDVWNDGRCVVCLKFHADMDCEQMEHPCPTIRTLAQPYQSHPGFKPEWII